jgi:hypothetical protein
LPSITALPPPPRAVGIGERATHPPTAGSCIQTFDTKTSGRPVLAPSISPPST